MKYYLGDVAKVIGTTKEGVRYLERKNLAKRPSMNQSGYREYDVLELAPLRWMRLYHSYGFSNREIARLMETEDPESISGQLGSGLDRINRELDFLEKIRDDLQEMKRDVEQMEERKGVFAVGERPAFYRISLAYDKVCSCPGSRLKEWFEHMPLVKSMQIHHLDDLRSGREAADLGLGIWEEELFGWTPMELPGTEYFPAEPSVIFWMEGPPITTETLGPAFEFMERQKLLVAGDIISRAAATYQKDGEQRYLHKFFVPYRKKTS